MRRASREGHTATSRHTLRSPGSVWPAVWLFSVCARELCGCLRLPWVTPMPLARCCPPSNETRTPHTSTHKNGSQWGSAKLAAALSFSSRRAGAASLPQANESQKKAARRKADAIKFYGSIAFTTSVRAVAVAVRHLWAACSRPSRASFPPQLLHAVLMFFYFDGTFTTWRVLGFVATLAFYAVAIYSLSAAAGEDVPAKYATAPHCATHAVPHVIRSVTSCVLTA